MKVQVQHLGLRMAPHYGLPGALPPTAYTYVCMLHGLSTCNFFQHPGVSIAMEASQLLGRKMKIYMILLYSTII